MIVFETDFANDQKGVKITDSIDPYAGAKAAIVDSGITSKCLYQSGGDNDPHLMIIDDPVGFSENGSVAMFSGGRRNHTGLQGWFGTEGLSEQRMFLNADHNHFPAGRAYMVEEWKVRPNVDGSSFRVPVRLLTDGEGGWGWMIHAVTAASDSLDEEYWAFENWDAPLPIGQPFVKRTYFQAGDPGKIKIVIEPEGAPAVVVFDLDVRTDSPHVTEVRSCQEWYVQMMYGTPSDFTHVANQGGTPKQYYDWWRFSIPGTEPTTDEPTPDEPTTEGELMLTYEWLDAEQVYSVQWGDAEVARGDDLSDTLDAYLAELKSSETAEKIRQVEDAIAAL